MKYLVLLLIVAGGIWWIRQQRPDRPGKSSDERQGTQNMVTCAHCGVHLPEHDAVQGQLGVYCSEAHRQRLET
jgi:uncharacterized protein